MRKAKMASLKTLVISIVVIIGIVTSFFSALTVYEQLNIHWFLDLCIAALAGIGTALFQAALIGFSRFIRGVPVVKGVMLIAAVVMTSITILGVYSGLQSSFFRNVVESGNYQRLSKQSESLQKKLDKQLELNHVTRSESTARQLNETNQALSNAEKSGTGSARNQWATNLSTVIGVDPNAVSFGRHTIIGLAIDLCYYLSLWFLFYGLLFREKTPLNAVLPIEEEYLDYDEDYRAYQKKNGSGSNNGNGQPIETFPENGNGAETKNSIELSPVPVWDTFKQPVGFTESGYTAQDKTEQANTEPKVIENNTHTRERYFLTDADRKKAEAWKESRRNYIKGLIAEYCEKHPDHGGRKIADYVNKQLENIPLKSKRGKRLKNTITHTTALLIKKKLEEEKIV